MAKTYRYGHRRVYRTHLVLLTIVLAVVVLAGGAYVVFRDLSSANQVQVKGESRVVGQIAGTNSTKLTITEPLFTLQLPADWKETGRQNTISERSITWQATLKGQDNRSLTVYIDAIPPNKPVNRLLPVTIENGIMVAGEISDNCATFTGGGSLEVAQAMQRRGTQAKWSGVDFICNLENVVDNQVGVGTAGALNQIALSGAQGKHNYFFVYTDRNIQPDYGIIVSVVESFRPR